MKPKKPNNKKKSIAKPEQYDGIIEGLDMFKKYGVKAVQMGSKKFKVK